jgi:hypothetical protein
MSLDAVSRKLQQLYSLVLRTERSVSPSPGGLALLDSLMKDPAWAWLRPLSALVAEIDHALAQSGEVAVHEQGAAAAHVRGLLFGDSDLRNEEFLKRYRPLLQLDPELASVHGELRQLLKAFPQEPENESERLHARHQWAMRCKHRHPLR